MSTFEKVWYSWSVLIPSIIIFTWIVQCIKDCIRKKTMDTQRQIVTSNRTGGSVFETERSNLSSYTLMQFYDSRPPVL